MFAQLFRKSELSADWSYLWHWVQLCQHLWSWFLAEVNNYACWLNCGQMYDSFQEDAALWQDKNKTT